MEQPSVVVVAAAAVIVTTVAGSEWNTAAGEIKIEKFDYVRMGLPFSSFLPAAKPTGLVETNSSFFLLSSFFQQDEKKLQNSSNQ